MRQYILSRGQNLILRGSVSIKGPDIVRSISAGLPSDGGRPSPCFGNDRDHSRVER